VQFEAAERRHELEPEAAAGIVGGDMHADAGVRDHDHESTVDGRRLQIERPNVLWVGVPNDVRTSLIHGHRHVFADSVVLAAVGPAIAHDGVAETRHILDAGWDLPVH
jgi:hypothetical protein